MSPVNWNVERDSNVLGNCFTFTFQRKFVVFYRWISTATVKTTTNDDIFSPCYQLQKGIICLGARNLHQIYEFLIISAKLIILNWVLDRCSISQTLNCIGAETIDICHANENERKIGRSFNSIALQTIRSNYLSNSLWRQNKKTKIKKNLTYFIFTLETITTIYLNSLENFAQTFRTIWHMKAIRRILSFLFLPFFLLHLICVDIFEYIDLHSINTRETKQKNWTKEKRHWNRKWKWTINGWDDAKRAKTNQNHRTFLAQRNGAIILVRRVFEQQPNRILTIRKSWILLNDWSLRVYPLNCCWLLF